MNDIGKHQTAQLETALRQSASLVEARLAATLSDEALPDETLRPQGLLEAMRHGALGGGKRLRPFLLMQSAALFDAPPEQSIDAACALECVHCYSLIHDDLPAMDDDDLRRGKPTVHRAYDEATAILAGDALLTMAFELMSSPSIEPPVAVELVRLLSRSAGAGGMAGGQALDLAAESSSLAAGEIETLQAMKTGALIRFACEAGAVIGGASPDERAALVSYGENLGKAFQLADDLLDVTASHHAMGKGTGKDQGRGKATLVAVHGIAESRTIAGRLADDAIMALSPFGNRAGLLAAAARFAVNRSY
jgi:farnesyl diphosphate synthase